MRILYLIAEIVALWVVITALGLLFIWLGRGFDDLGQLMAFCFVVVAFAISIKLATIGDHRSIADGVYRPIRLLSLILPALGAFRGDSTLPGYGHRRTFAFAFEGGSITSYDVIDRLSAALDRDGIGHAKAGGILCEDNGTTWWLEPDIGANRVTGWVESARSENRKQIIDAVRAFIEQDMRVQII